jgi:acetyl esterase/lipase
MFTLALSVTLVLAVSETARAQPAATAPVTSKDGKAAAAEIQLKIYFDNLDKDHDGQVNDAEMPAEWRSGVSIADTNKDKMISFAELSEFMIKLKRFKTYNITSKKPPEGVTAKYDIPYVENGHVRQKLDLFLPTVKEGQKKFPVVVWIHGGGWVGGSKENPPGGVLLSKGFAVASINYRFSNHAVYPAQIHDCKAAIRWLRAHAAEYNLDADHIGAWGASAGGHLTALLAVTGDVKELEGDLGNNDQSSRVQAACDWFGPTDFTDLTEYLKLKGPLDHASDKSPLPLLLGGPVTDNLEKARQASPILFVSSDDAPILIMHGEKDNVVPYSDSVKFDKELKKQHVSSTLMLDKESGHNFATRPDFYDEVTAFFVQHLQSH